MTLARRIADNFVPLLMALGGLVAGRLALTIAARQEASPLWQAAAALLAYTLTVALLGRIGDGDPYDAVADATRALAYILQAVLTGALQILSTTVQLLAVLCGGLAALTAPATT